MDGMRLVFTEAMQSNAAFIKPRAKRSQGLAGWCSSEEAKAKMHAASQEREAARDTIGFPRKILKNVVKERRLSYFPAK